MIADSSRMPIISSGNRNLLYSSFPIAWTLPRVGLLIKPLGKVLSVNRIKQKISIIIAQAIVITKDFFIRDFHLSGDCSWETSSSIMTNKTSTIIAPA